MQNWNVMRDLLGADQSYPLTAHCKGFVISGDGEYFDYVEVYLTKSGIIRIMGELLKLGYQEFAVYVYVSDDNNYVSDDNNVEVKVLEMDPSHVWYNTDMVTS